MQLGRTCFSADSFHLLCCIKTCESYGRFFRATRYLHYGVRRVMGCISGWCNVCRNPVRNIDRHCRRHHPVTDLPPPSTLSAATAVQAEFAGASSPGTPVQDEISGAAVQATSAELSDTPQAIDERLALQLPEPAEARTVLLYTTNPAHSSSLRGPLCDVTSVDLIFGLRIPDSTTRQRCYCRTCVRHALRLAVVTRDVPIPTAPGVRFVTLPGLQLKSSSDGKRRRLDVHLSDNRGDSNFVCGCAPCVLHRNMTKAWLQALLLAPPRGKVVATAT